MKVILIEDVKSVGSMGDVVSVKDGYARNFLFPGKLARPATDSNMKIIEDIKRKKTLIEAKERKALEELRDRLSSFSCTITAESGEDDKLFGSVSSGDIAKAFEEENLAIDKKQIILEEPIKRLGVYTVPVKLHPEIIAEVKVWVVKK